MMTDQQHAPASIASASFSAADLVGRLEEDIVLGRLLPRERLVEDELISRFGTSRHIVRQALVELGHMGLVVRVPNRGAVVARLSDDEIDQLHAYRRVLECEAAQRIRFPLDPVMLAELASIQARHDHAVESGDLVALFRSNHAFHRCLFAFCGNRFLIEGIEAAAQRAHGIRFLPMRVPRNRLIARQQHHAMLDALKCHDRDRLVRLCHDHIAHLKSDYAPLDPQSSL